MRKVMMAGLMVLVWSWGTAQTGDGFTTMKGNVREVTVKEVRFPAKDSMVEGKTCVLSYGKDGRKEKVTCFEKGERSETGTYFYNEDGTLATRYRERINGTKYTTTFKYAKGMLTETVDIVNDKEDRRTVVKCNAAGKPEFEWGYKDGVRVSERRYLYDSEGNCVENTSYGADGKKILEKTTYKYNKYHDAIECRTFSGDKLIREMRYEYDYDKKNNWTKRSIHRMDKKEAEETRAITYY